MWPTVFLMAKIQYILKRDSTLFLLCPCEESPVPKGTCENSRMAELSDCFRGGGDPVYRFVVNCTKNHEKNMSDLSIAFHSKSF